MWIIYNIYQFSFFYKNSFEENKCITINLDLISWDDFLRIYTVCM